MLVRNLALVSTTNQTTPSELSITASAIQKQATRDLGPIWGISATVDYFTDINSVPVGYWPIIIADNINEPGAAGFHTDQHHQPYALVQYDKTWQLTCSHEAMEMLVDPYGNRMVAANSIDPNNPGRVNYLVEVCDPCEDASFAYSINGIQVSDFYTPDYFDPVGAGAVRYSLTGAVKAPRQVLPNGYLSWHDPITKKWYQATYFGATIAINPLDGMKANSESLRAQVDRLTKNPNKDESFDTAFNKHQLIQEKTFHAAAAHAKNFRSELAAKKFL